MARTPDVTRWLARMSEGDPDALDRVVRLVYDELRATAQNRLRNERDDHTLSATALVNEVYLRLTRLERITASDRVQFFAIAATTMRRVLVDYARARHRQKRGGGQPHVPLEDVEPFLSDEESDEVIALDLALGRLSEMNERAAKVVELRFYGGLSVEDAAQALGVSTKTVQRDWITARAWLRSAVQRELG
jgi:RNA polymerase sigma factor (TIGR02999 family)